jgi:hypothetical protein
MLKFKDLRLHRKTPVEIRYVYLGNKEIYCIFLDMLHNIYFPQNGIHFIIFSFSVKITLIFS